MFRGLVMHREPGQVWKEVARVEERNATVAIRILEERFGIVFAHRGDHWDTPCGNWALIQTYRKEKTNEKS